MGDRSNFDLAGRAVGLHRRSIAVLARRRSHSVSRKAVGMLASLSLVGIAATAVPAAQATPTTVVVPNVSPSTTSGNNAFPFDCAPALPSQRYQQVYAGSQVGSGSISQIAFRPKFDAFPPTVIPNVTITLSTTSRAVTGLDTTFANNVGADVKTVFLGDLTLSSAGGSFGGPDPFDIVIPLQTPFVFNPTGGNLLLDVTVPTCKQTGAFDFDCKSTTTTSAPVARVFTLSNGAGSATGSDDRPEYFCGLVTQFTFGGPSGPPCVTGSHPGPLALGPGTSCVDGATIGGNVTIPPGANVTIRNSSIGGSIAGDNGGSFDLCGSSVSGNVSIQRASGFVRIGDPGHNACSGNSIGRSVTLSSNGAGYEIGHNPGIGGNVTLTGNNGFSSVDDGGNEIEANVIGGRLDCQGNTPSPTQDGQPNTISGGRSNQCGISSGF